MSQVIESLKSNLSIFEQLYLFMFIYFSFSYYNFV